MLPSMETPDERLPEQTRLCVQSYASNAAGNATSPEACVTPIASIGPSATMYGLRFDPDRKTQLIRSGDSTNTFTFSVWFKYDGNATTYTSIFASAGSSNIVPLGYTGTDFYVYDGGTVFNFGHTPQANVWQHVVVAVNDKSVARYVNGVKKEVTTNTTIAIDGATIGFNGATNGEFAGGYLSDCYMVSSQVLPATTFGNNYEGKWGPLDSAVVETNVGDFGESGFYLPFDPEATGENYSAGAKTGATYSSQGWDKAFDGDGLSGAAVGNYAQAQQNDTSLTFTTPVPFTTLRVSAGKLGPDDGSIKFNGSTVHTVTEAYEFQTVTGVTSPLSSIGIDANQTVAAIEAVSYTHLTLPTILLV